MSLLIDEPRAAEVGELHTFTAAVQWSAETRGGARKLRGHAAVFNSPSEWMGFREVILPGAFARTLQRHPDVFLYFGHDRNSPLARTTAGNLQLKEDARGLAFEAELPDTQLARDALELVRSGVVHQMSFSFMLAPRGFRDETKGGELWRYVSDFEQLFEISLVTEPAYVETSVEARGRRSIRRPRSVADGPYGPGSKHSWFRDVLVVSRSRAENDARREVDPRWSPDRRYDVGPSDPRHGGVKEAQERVDRIAREERATSSVSLDFVPSGAVPGFIADLFATAARTRAAVATILPFRPLPKALEVKAPRWKVGAAVGVQSGELVDVKVVTEPEAGMFTSPLATIAGYVDGVQQLLDFAGGEDDEWIAQELGKAIAAKLEQEVIQANGANGRFQGLLSVAGTTVTHTDATPTAAENFSALGQGYADTATAYGGPIDTLVLHSRRRAWIETKIGYAPRFPALVVESNGVPTNLGAGSNEDAAIYLARGETILLTNPPTIEVMIELASSDKLGVRVRAYQYAALLAGRLPESIGKVTGSGLAAPSW